MKRTTMTGLSQMVLLVYKYVHNHMAKLGQLINLTGSMASQSVKLINFNLTS